MKTTNWILLILLSASLWAEEGAVCREGEKVYDSGGQFNRNDFVAGGQGLIFDSAIHPDFGGAIDTENIVFPTDQPFFIDYIGEGAGASHLFGFFFLDIDTNKNGIPDFFETGKNDDLDGDGIPNYLDDDDDGDGIDDDKDNLAGQDSALVEFCMPGSFFRNGEEAEAAGDTAGDYWQFVPSHTISYTSPLTGDTEKIFAHPGAFLFVDNNKNQVPDILENPDDIYSSPSYVVNKTHDKNGSNVHYGAKQFPALLGTWDVKIGGIGTNHYWLGSTVFKLADDDGDTGTSGDYKYSPYNIKDKYSNTNAEPDYDIYGTTDPASPLIPDLVKIKDPRGVDYWKYRWYQSNISGGREICFYLTVFYNSGSRRVNTYYSKSGFNPDPGSSYYPTPDSSKPSGDKYGETDSPAGSQTANNWFPKNDGKLGGSGTRRTNTLKELNKVSQYAWKLNWQTIANTPLVDNKGAASTPKPGHEDKADWISKWDNWDESRMVINYIALRNWLDSAGNNEDIVQERYDIDLEAEEDVSLVRKINGNMAHLLVGAPESDDEAWLLGWEDLYNGGDVDYEDVVFYVMREARGSAQSLNVASDLDRFDDVSLATVEFTFEDNWVKSKQGAEGHYINYYYRLASTDEWIPLLGGEHTALPNIFTENEESGGIVRRHVILQLADEGKRELYWKVEMHAEDVSFFEPKVTYAEANYHALVHDVFYNSGIISSSNVEYYGAYETPSLKWMEKSMNRGHLYNRKVFEHGNPITMSEIEDGISPEDYLNQAPPSPWLWDAGYTTTSQIGTSSAGGRNVISFVSNDKDPDFKPEGSFKTQTVKAGALSDEFRDALGLSSSASDGVIVDNFHDPAGDFDPVQASDWLADWIYGYYGSVAGVSGKNREWILGGLNRASPALLRAPGIPFWMEGSAIDVNVKKSYYAFMEAQKDVPTRVLIGTESGMIHSINAGQWVGERENPNDTWADGHYTSYGDGSEIWAVIPNNLLNDIKYNYTGQRNVSARVDSTPMMAVIRYKGEWKRVAIMTQGENGGEHQGRYGNVVWAMDVTDPDNPLPLWERSGDNYHQQITQVSIGWLKEGPGGENYNGEGIWVSFYTSGALLPTPTTRGSLCMVDAYTGDLLQEWTLNSGEFMAGTPALMDQDGDGYLDYAYGGTNHGRILAINLKSFSITSHITVSGHRFFLSPNIQLMGEKSVMIATVSGDNPLVNDETASKNAVFSIEHNTEDNSLSILNTYELKPGHKAFSRPLLMGRGLLLATTTGETFDYCDFDPDDPGDLILIGDIVSGDDVDTIERFGSVKAPITGGGRIHVHKSMVSRYEDWNDPGAGTAAGSLKLEPKYQIPPKYLKANIFMPLGWDMVIPGESF
jgi:hypothetical protein